MFLATTAKNLKLILSVTFEKYFTNRMKKKGRRRRMPFKFTTFVLLFHDTSFFFIIENENICQRKKTFKCRAVA